MVAVKAAPVRRARIGIRQLEVMLVGALRKPDLFHIFSEKIDVSDFNIYEQYLSVIWEQTSAFYNEFQKLPTKMELGSLLSQEQADHQRFDEAGWAELVTFFDAIYQVPEPALISESVLRQWAAMFKADRVASALKTVIDDPSTIPVDIGDIVKSYAEDIVSASAVHCATDKDLMPFPEGWESKDRMKKTLTGLEFIDTILGGGLISTCVYSLMGPFGSCKTTMAVQMSVQLAKLQAAQWRKSGRTVPLGKVFFVTYEETSSAIRYRATATVANIETAVLTGWESDGYIRPLSTRDKLCDRDKAEYRDLLAQGLVVLSEQERRQQAEYALSENWRLMDLRNDEELMNVASSKLYPTVRIARTIASILETDAKEGNPSFCAGVFIDYGGAAVDDYIESVGVRSDREAQSLLERFPRGAKNDIATPFKCPVVVLHQLTGEANDQREGVVMRHTKAAGSKSWGRNFDYCLQISVPTKEGICMLSCSKHRYTGPKQDQILRIVGACSTVVSANETHVFDARTKRIISREAVEEETQKKKQKPKQREAEFSKPTDFYDQVFMR